MNDTSSLDIILIFDLNSFLVGLIFSSWILLQLDQNKNKNGCSKFRNFCFANSKISDIILSFSYIYLSLVRFA